MRIIHISTVHHELDPRIRLKQLQSIQKEGWKARLICCCEAYRQLDDGVVVEALYHRRPHRLRRMAIAAPRAMFRAARRYADAYHLHDPELLPWVWLLHIKGRPVIYDIHEDYVRSVKEREYIPSELSSLIAAVLDGVEKTLSVACRRVIAEPAYKKRFPTAGVVPNYPQEQLRELGPALDTTSNRLLYTGNVTIPRGALQLARLIRYTSLSLMVVGKCDTALAQHMRSIAGDLSDGYSEDQIPFGADTTFHESRLAIQGVGRHVPFSEIRTAYAGGGWLAGIVLIPDSSHYREKHLTKFFEYMAVGLPIIASDVPVWRELIEDAGVGLCVDPNSPEAVAEAAERLQRSPEVARHMSETGRRLVRDYYTWEREAERLLSLYRR